MKIVGIVVLIALTFLVPVRSYSEQDLLLRLKNVYGYDAWAGKTGAMKQEPALDSLVLPGNVFIGNTPNPEGITYVWGEAPDKPQISATVKTYSSIEEAQIGLINILGRFSTILPKAEAQGLKIGDAGFMLN